MTTDEAIEIANGWLRYLDEQRARAKRMEDLAKLAKTDFVEARRQLLMLDRGLRVYDAAKLEDAVKHLIKIVEV